MAGKDGTLCSHTLELDLWTGAKPQTSKGGGKGASGGFGDMGDMGWMFMEFMKMMNPGMKKGFGKGKGGPKKEEPEKKVRVENLPVGAGWQDLKDHMRPAGSVEYVKTSGTTGEVRYNTKGEATKAVRMLNGSMMEQGGPIMV